MIRVLVALAMPLLSFWARAFSVGNVQIKAAGGATCAGWTPAKCRANLLLPAACGWASSQTFGRLRLFKILEAPVHAGIEVS